MAQKSNPISLRLRKTNKLWNSCWYGDYNYTTQLLQDRGVSAYIQNICQQAKMTPPVVFINRQRQQTSTFFFFSRQEKTRRLIRPSRSPWQKSARGGVDWLDKLLFWSCKVPVHAPMAVDHNFQRQRPLPVSAPSAGPKKRNPQPLAGYYSGKLFGLFSYLLVSQALIQNCQASKPELEISKSRARLDLSPPRPALLHGGETTSSSQPWKFFLSTLKKSTPRNEKTRITRPRAGAVNRAVAAPGNVNLWKTQPQDWGFIALRNLLHLRTEQYFASEKIRASASFPGRFSPPASRVQQRSVGRSVNAMANNRPPWRTHLESCISRQTQHNSTLHFILCPSVHQNPLFLASQLCSSLEARKPFRRLKDKIIRDISANENIKGVRITCSGRVAARSKKAQKARTESIQWGQTSLNVFSDLVNFASKSALTPFGKIGVKVWICYKKIK